MHNILNSHFDLYSRYKLSSDIINFLRKGKRLKMIDIGGNTDILSKFFKKDEVIVFNKTSYVIPNQVIGNAKKTNYHDNYFDFTVCLDTLEHMADRDRLSVIKEILRITKDFSIIGFPYKNHEIILKEGVAFNLYKKIVGKNHLYLREHLRYGLPDNYKISSYLDKDNIKYTIIDNTDLNIWLLLTVIGFYGEIIPEMNHKFLQISRFFNKNLYVLGNNPSYRKIFIIGKRKKIDLKNFYTVDLKKKARLYEKLFETLDNVNESKNRIILFKIKNLIKNYLR